MDQINFFKCLADETRFNIVMLVLEIMNSVFVI
jgi:ArsR family transcriptional regulator